MLLKRTHAAAIVLAASSVFAAPLPAQILAVTGATLIDGTGREPVSDGVVLISDGRIAAIGSEREVAIPRAAKKLDARGKYLIPGLMDANTHLTFTIDLETMIKYEDRYDQIALEGAQVSLKNGLTTVFDTAGHRAALVKARDLINSGKAPGSRIYLAGYIFGFSSPLGSDISNPAVLSFVSKTFAKRVKDTWEEGIGQELLWMTPEEVRPIVRDYTHKGVNFLKYGSSGHGAWPEVATFNYLAFSPRVQKVIVEEGHRAGLTVQAHTTSVESLDTAIEAGVDIITHGDVSGTHTPIPQETLRKLVERHVSVSVIPATQAYLDAELEQTAKSPPKLGYTWPQFQKLSRTNQTNMMKAGVALLLSTDSSLPNPVQLAEMGRPPVDPQYIGEGHFNALVALEEQGMAPQEILKTATSNIARAYKVYEDVGTLEVGKIADLVILERNPLESARNYRSISAVIKDGKVVDRAGLPVAPVIGPPAPRSAKAGG